MNQTGFGPFSFLFLTTRVGRLGGQDSIGSCSCSLLAIVKGPAWALCPGEGLVGRPLPCLFARIWTLTSVGRTRPVKPVSALRSPLQTLGPGFGLLPRPDRLGCGLMVTGKTGIPALIFLLHSRPFTEFFPIQELSTRTLPKAPGTNQSITKLNHASAPVSLPILRDLHLPVSNQLHISLKAFLSSHISRKPPDLTVPPPRTTNPSTSLSAHFLLWAKLAPLFTHLMPSLLSWTPSSLSNSWY